MIKRAYEPLDPYLVPNRVLVIYGPRQVGKTTLLERYLSETQLNYRYAIGDDLPTQQILGSLDIKLIREYLEGYTLFAIDEAQYVPDIGRVLKIIVDQIPEIYVIATGSSSFELAGQVGEPLTGRKRTLTLFPAAQVEMLSLYNRFELRQNLEECLIFGTYPDIVMEKQRREKINIIREIAGSYLFKDILAFDRVKASKKLWDLLKLLAFQLGSEVSLNELANSLGINARTIEHYLDLLEKSFVIYRLGGFSRNLRKEITQKSKYYFFDNGIRNAVVAQFNHLDQRDDAGALWENFIVMERVKFLTYSFDVANLYFWRTYSQQEIDWVEERGTELDSFEFKWSFTKEQRCPPEWARAYPKASYTVITPKNYQEFVLPRSK
jgi:predicted AAA+ superfamily ATPase